MAMPSEPVIHYSELKIPLNRLLTDNVKDPKPF